MGRPNNTSSTRDQPCLTPRRRELTFCTLTSTTHAWPMDKLVDGERLLCQIMRKLVTQSTPTSPGLPFASSMPCVADERFKICCACACFRMLHSAMGDSPGACPGRLPRVCMPAPDGVHRSAALCRAMLASPALIQTGPPKIRSSKCMHVTGVSNFPARPAGASVVLVKCKSNHSFKATPRIKTSAIC